MMTENGEFRHSRVFTAFLQDSTRFSSRVAIAMISVHNSDHALSGDDARNARWLRVA